MFKHPAVYILIGMQDGTLQVGMASNFQEETRKRQADMDQKMVWYELHECVAAAREQEQLLKEADHESIRRMIEQTNPEWKNLFEDGDHVSPFPTRLGRGEGDKKDEKGDL